MEENTTLYGVVEELNEEVTNETYSAASTGLALLIGGLIGAVVVKGGSLAIEKIKGVIEERKAKKELLIDAKIVDELDEEEVDSDDDAE